MSSEAVATIDPTISKKRKLDEEVSKTTSKRAIKQKGGIRPRKGTRDESFRVDPDEPKEARLPKRQCALLLGFCGSSYYGMQYQPNNGEHLPTIEGTLFEALVRAGAISKDNSDDPTKVHMLRAARTDKGVHAAGNVVSLKMITEVPGQPNMVECINRELPEDIRVWDFVRVQNSFNARTACDSRKYTYFFPSHMLIPPKPGSELAKTLEKHDTSRTTDPVHEFWVNQNLTSTPDEDLIRKRAWRATPYHLEILRATVQKYLGTHSFHNFTLTKDMQDPSNIRFMKEISVEEPQVYGETEWIAVLLHGQSFMLHQIRKMMFLLIMTCRTSTPDTVISKMYSNKTKILIPKMPALGLLLEAPIYDAYNTKMAIQCKDMDKDDVLYRGPIDFAAQAPKMQEFKQKFIYDNMRTIEDRKGLFDAWLRSVDSYYGSDLLYLNKEGQIPDECVIHIGKPRSNGFHDNRKFDLTSFTPEDDAKMTAEPTAGPMEYADEEGSKEGDM